MEEAKGRPTPPPEEIPQWLASSDSGKPWLRVLGSSLTTLHLSLRVKCYRDSKHKHSTSMSIVVLIANLETTKTGGRFFLVALKDHPG